MTSQFSERFHDQERMEVYLDLVQSSLDRPLGSEQTWFLDQTSASPGRARSEERVLPRISFRWLSLPRFPVPFLTWA